MGAAFTAIDDEKRLISLIWFSTNSSTVRSHENEEQQLSIEATLRDSLTSSVTYLKTFTDTHQCETHVRCKKHERIVLVVANTDFDQIQAFISDLHDLRQCHSVYILNTIDTTDQTHDFSAKFSKVSR